MDAPLIRSESARDATAPVGPARQHPRLLAWLQLCRIPNVFTALADVLLGYLLVHDGLESAWLCGLLLASSASLYTAGMVLNDYFDRDIDARERPKRPIPSGRIPVHQAGRLGYGLLVAGLAFAWIASLASGQWRTGAVASVLAGAVLAYDGLLKRTLLAPLAMGSCRFLNVLLGLSLAPSFLNTSYLHTMHWIVAAGLGVYIAGVTWFARTEAVASSRWQLGVATLVIALGLGIVGAYPLAATSDLDDVGMPHYALAVAPGLDAGGGNAGTIALAGRWPIFWTALTALIVWRCVKAVVEPVPLHVQAAVKHCLLSLIIVDAAACWAVRGMSGALWILPLLLPAMFLGRWVYST